MVALTEKLIDKGFAYEKHKSIYYDISSFPEYGKLSGVDLDKIKVGHTVDLEDYEKNNPKDFTLLKKTKLSELKRGIFAKTKWGNVRPSLHLQCAAISTKYLGDSFDIHTSSRELVFPHHENEIAIAQAVNKKPLAKYWIHCDRVLVDGKKIDEQSTRVTLKDLTNLNYNGREIRYWLISGHYRKPLSYTTDRLKEAEKSLKRLDQCIHGLLNIKNGKSDKNVDKIIKELETGFTNAMDDDLNIAVAMASIFKVVKKLNPMINANKIDKDRSAKLIEIFRNINSVLQIFDFESKYSDPAVQYLLQERLKARDEKNWNKSDKIREQLKAYSIFVQDEKS